MKRIIFGMIVALLTIAPIHSGTPETKNKCADSHCEWVENSLKEMQTIKEGMTRRQLKSVFMEEGGTFNRFGRSYIYRKCQFFRVSVKFKPVGDLKNHSESPDDMITEISEPFLGWTHVD
jgi:hypothetical protein